MVIEQLYLPFLSIVHRFDSKDLVDYVLAFRNEHLVLLERGERSDLVSHLHETSQDEESAF